MYDLHKPILVSLLVRFNHDPLVQQELTINDENFYFDVLEQCTYSEWLFKTFFFAKKHAYKKKYYCLTSSKTNSAHRSDLIVYKKYWKDHPLGTIDRLFPVLRQLVLIAIVVWKSLYYIINTRLVSVDGEFGENDGATLIIGKLTFNWRIVTILLWSYGMGKIYKIKVLNITFCQLESLIKGN